MESVRWSGPCPGVVYRMKSISLTLPCCSWTARPRPAHPLLRATPLRREPLRPHRHNLSPCGKPTSCLSVTPAWRPPPAATSRRSGRPALPPDGQHRRHVPQGPQGPPRLAGRGKEKAVRRDRRSETLVPQERQTTSSASDQDWPPGTFDSRVSALACPKGMPVQRDASALTTPSRKGP